VRAFLDDYPMARAWLVYTGARRYHDGPIEIVPLPDFLAGLRDLL
jgi:hypothetical protein